MADACSPFGHVCQMEAYRGKKRAVRVQGLPDWPGGWLGPGNINGGHISRGKQDVWAISVGPDIGYVGPRVDIGNAALSIWSASGKQFVANVDRNSLNKLCVTITSCKGI